jgi:hypothetical protein
MLGHGTTTPADGTTGTPNPADTAASAAAPAASGAKTPRTFTQDELDTIVEARLKRAVPADYEELKALKVSKDAEDEKTKTETQKAEDARVKREGNLAKRETALDAKAARLAVIEAAAAAKATDVDIVAALLAGSPDITVDKDGNVLGAKEAVEALLKTKPVLAGSGTPNRVGGEFGGTDQKTAAEKIRQLEIDANLATDPRIRQAKLAEARDLKMSQMVGPARS